MIRRFNAWANRNPLLAVWLGFIVAFLIMCAAEPLLVKQLDHPTYRSAT